MKTLLDGLKSTWSLLVQTACWIGMVVGKFAQQPPATTLTAGPDDGLRHFTEFLGTLVIGMLVIACLKWKAKSATRGWTVATGALFVVTLALFFTQRSLADRWTIPYAVTHSLTIATDLTPEAASYQKSLPHPLSPDELLSKSGGDAAQVWPAEDSSRNYRYLAACMIALWIASAASIVCVSQAIRCASSEQISPNAG